MSQFRTLFFKTSHIKRIHFVGAHTFHNLDHHHASSFHQDFVMLNIDIWQSNHHPHSSRTMRSHLMSHSILCVLFSTHPKTPPRNVPNVLPDLCLVSKGNLQTIHLSHHALQSYPMYACLYVLYVWWSHLAEKTTWLHPTITSTPIVICVPSPTFQARHPPMTGTTKVSAFQWLDTSCMDFIYDPIQSKT